MARAGQDWRDARFYPEPLAADEYRTPAQRDRDRIIHTSAFVRLAGVTQVVPPTEEGHLLHNRMTHSIKVAQVARRIAEYVNRQYARECAEVGGVDPDVVETAALAHDLGHPPFGHIGEEALKSAAYYSGLSDAFEGNAQTFRIVTKLACRSHDYPGLNLTRATLNAILKYPWTRGTGGHKREKKWSVYQTEEKEFEFARSFDMLSALDQRKSPEAELMDWADDIAYSVHDIEDFYRVGLIPLHRLSATAGTDAEVENFLDGALERRRKAGLEGGAPYSPAELRKAFEEVRRYFPSAPYQGTEKDRTDLRVSSKQLIGKFVRAIKICPLKDAADGFVAIRKDDDAAVAILKELTWHYVINNPALAMQQYGQKRVVTELYQVFEQAMIAGNFNMFPAATRDLLRRLIGRDAAARKLRRQLRGIATWTDEMFQLHKQRIVVDVLAGMTEQQMLRVHHRLTGVSPGSGIERVYL